MKSAHDGRTLAEKILLDDAGISKVTGERVPEFTAKWSHELAAEHEFVAPGSEVMDSGWCACGEEIFPADDECTSCLHGSVSPAAAERAIDAAEGRFEDR